MLILPGYSDSVDFLGYLIERCPDCHQTGVFAVFDTRRRLTITFIPTPVNINKMRVMECRTCGARFSVPEKLDAKLSKKLLTQEQLSDRIRELRANGGYLGSPTQPNAPKMAGGRRTAYQVLQVDPAADPDVIEAAFKRLALKSHPDRTDDPESAARMRDLLEARDILTDPNKRRGYDLSLGIARPASAYAPAPTKTSSPRSAPSDPRQGPSQGSNGMRPQANGAPSSAPRSPAPPRGPVRPLPAPGPRPKGIRPEEV